MASDYDTQSGGGDLTDTEVIRLQAYLKEAIGPGKAFETYTALGDKAGVSDTTIRNARDGKSISNRTFNKLASAFGFKPSELKRELEMVDADQEVHRDLADEIRTAMSDLPEEDREEILAFIRLKAELRRKRQ